MYHGYGNLNYHHTWLIVKVDEDICRYYRKLIGYQKPSLKLNPQKDGAHITVIAGKYEVAPKQEFWRMYENEKIQFEYNTEIDNDGEYFWMPVKCKRIEDIREELGLPRIHPIPWHLTIGNRI